MKNNAFLCILLLLLLLPIVHSETSGCQYIDIQNYVENEVVLAYENSDVQAGKALVFSDFTRGNKTSFMIFNPNEYDVIAILNYTIEGHGAGNRDYGIKVPANEYTQVKEMCYYEDKFGECGIIQQSVTYFISKPKIMYPKTLPIQKERTLCDKPCTTNSDCGTICHQDGYCGKLILPCKNGKNSCHDVSCVTPGTLDAGEPYFLDCDWECKSGKGAEGLCIGNDGDSCDKPADCLSGICTSDKLCSRCLTENLPCKDNLCRKPNVKENGEAYDCVGECKSGAGKNGVCKDSLPTVLRKLIRFLVMLAIGLGAAWWLLLRAINEKKIRREIEERRQNDKAIEEAKTELEKLIDEGKRVEDQNRKLNELLELQKQLKENDKEVTKPRRAIILGSAVWEWRNPELKYYPCYFNRNSRNPRTSTLIHRNQAEKCIFNNPEYRSFFEKFYPNTPFTKLKVHHIDRYTDNYRLENLIILKKEEHDLIDHSKIKMRDRASGILELQRLNLKAPHIPELNSDSLTKWEWPKKQQGCKICGSPSNGRELCYNCYKKRRMRSKGNVFAPKSWKKVKKIFYCIDCNREIRHKGRCLPCNAKAKKRRQAQDKKY